jgi:hypothetical protein
MSLELRIPNSSKRKNELEVLGGPFDYVPSALRSG